MNKHRFIVSAIDTNMGKTIVSAILAEALSAMYWKPIQSGDLENSDSKKIAALTEGVSIIPETIKLKLAASPHLSAKEEGIKLTREQFSLPFTEGNLIVEGAGGLLVPLNDDGLLLADLFKDWHLPVILVCRNYLGSINHTLLSLEVLKQRSIPIAGLIYVGDAHEPSESIISKIGKIPTLARILLVKTPDKHFVKKEALRLKPILDNLR